VKWACYVCATTESTTRHDKRSVRLCEPCAHRYPVASGIAPMTTAAHVPVVTPPQDEYIPLPPYARLDPTW
jgi:hypothetical protein